MMPRQRGGGRAGLFRPRHDARRGPRGVAAVGLGHVGRVGRMTGAVAAHVRGDAVVPAEDLDGAGRKAHVQCLTDEAVRRRVEVVVGAYFDVFSELRRERDEHLDLLVAISVPPTPICVFYMTCGTDGSKTDCREVRRLAASVRGGT
jgi:hypothetical protein